jgi:sugar lactone lactonase YvrE
MYKPELILPSKCIIGEGPLWDAENKLLYFIDIIDKKIFCLDTKTNEVEEMDCGQYVGMVGFSKENDFIAALQHGFYYVDFKNKKMTQICDPESDKPNNRFNDGKVGPGGMLLAGSVCLDWDNGCGTNDPLSKLYRMNKHHDVKVLDEAVIISNGTAWTQDEKTLYFIDSATFKVFAFDYDKKTGDTSNKRVVINVPEEKGFPDGMTIDEEGKLWICHWGGSAVHRWDPDTGKIMESIPMPVSQPTCCAFGGDNMDELYITSACNGVEEELAGGLFKVKLNVKGFGPYVFGQE